MLIPVLALAFLQTLKGSIVQTNQVSLSVSVTHSDTSVQSAVSAVSVSSVSNSTLTLTHPTNNNKFTWILLLAFGLTID